ncbi:MAG TPA: NAD(P)(+) transhydrogenase (Re/Si-specific) subunit beta [Polyangia bacterium]|nr:NAD(P)(+) transhydrogenase (Re/Si-specific) subunit beta [Polyangia bacterium]
MSETLRGTGAALVYLGAAVAVFLTLKAVAKVRIAKRGRVLASIALGLAVLGAIFELGTAHLSPALIGVVLGGLAVGAVAGSRGSSTPPASRVAWIAGLAGAAAALTAAGVVTESGLPLADTVVAGAAVVLGVVSLGLGLVVSLGGSLSVSATAAAALVAAFAGWAAALVGFAVENVILLVAGGVSGTAALALARLVARAANRGLGAALFGGAADESGYTNVRSCGTDEAAMVLETAGTVLLVPGFGMPAAQAQHSVKEVAEQLEKRGTRVVYAVSPSAGCLPGHMNIALDEANVPHEKIVDLSAAQDLVKAADAVLVVGANDTINARAATDRSSPLYGLAALDLETARSVFVVKRSLRPGAAGVKNALFERPNTMMMFGDGKRVMQALVAELKGGGH